MYYRAIPIWRHFSYKIHPYINFPHIKSIRFISPRSVAPTCGAFNHCSWGHILTLHATHFTSFTSTARAHWELILLHAHFPVPAQCGTLPHCIHTLIIQSYILVAKPG